MPHTMIASAGTTISYRRAALDVVAPTSSDGWTFAAKVKLDTLPVETTYLFNGGGAWSSAWKNSAYVADDGTLWASVSAPLGSGLGYYDVGTNAAVFTGGGAAKTIHIVCDITQAAAADKIKIYVDGVQQATTAYENIAGSGPIAWTGNAVSTRVVFNGTSVNHTSGVFTATTGKCLDGEAGFYFFDFEPITDTTRFYNGGDVDINTIKGTGAFCLSGPVADWNAGTNNLGDAGALVVVGTYSATSASHNGEATITGTGSEIAAGITGTFGVAAFTGTGTQAISGVVTRIGAAALVGTSNQTAAGQRMVSGTAALSGVGNQVVSGVSGSPGGASLVGTGSLAASGVRSASGAATLGVGTGLTVSAWLTRIGAATLQGVWSMSVWALGPAAAILTSALRRITVPPEDRRLTVPAEDRSTHIAFE